MSITAKELIKENIILIKNDEIEKFLSQEVPKELLDEVIELMIAAGYPENRLKTTRDAVASKIEFAIINCLLEKGIRNYVVMIRDFHLCQSHSSTSDYCSYKYYIEIHINGKEYKYGPKEIYCNQNHKYEAIANNFVSNNNIRLI